MKVFLRIVLSLFFIPVFLIFLLLTSLKFQLLNYNFVISSFEKNKIYDNVQSFQQSVLLEQEKKGSKAELDIEITPAMAKEFLEKNLKSILGFINGESGQIMIFIPNIGETELTKLAPNFPKEMLDNIQKWAGFVMPAWVITLGLILGIIFVLFKLGWKKDKFSEGFFICISLVLVILGLLVRFFLIQMGRDLVKPGISEPSQVLIGMMANSLLPEIVNLWIIIAFSLIPLSIGILILKKFRKI